MDRKRPTELWFGTASQNSRATLAQGTASWSWTPLCLVRGAPAAAVALGSLRHSRKGDPQMAIGLRIKFSDGTQEQYDAIHSHMGVDSNPPEGMIFHSAGPIDGG